MDTESVYLVCDNGCVEIPVGYCQCGCGQKTKIAERSSTRKGWVKGQPLRFIQGHATKGEYASSVRKLYSIEDPPDWYLPNTNDGFCHCGCGLKTKPARYTSRDSGTIKGALQRFVANHRMPDEQAKSEAKICSMCGEEKPLSHFYRGKRYAGGYKSYCMACHKADPSQQPGAKRESRQAMLQRNRRYVWDYYCSHPCVDCGEADPIVLEFDHVRGEKLAGVSQLVNNGRSLEVIQEEIDKCEVVCVNCHRRRTAKTQDWYATVA